MKSISRMRREKDKDEADFLDREIAEPEAWIAHAEGRDDEAIRMLQPLAERENEGESKTGYLPAQEVLADLLLEAHRPQEALAEYQTDLKLNPNRFNGLYGAARAAEQAGKQSEANEYYALLLKTCAGSSSARPELSHAKELLATR